LAKKGWISLHRSIQDNWIWQDKPFDKRSAWIDILLMANHQDNKVCFGNEIIHVEEGSFITSEVKLMDRWGWSKSKTRNFLKLLEEDKMIFKKTDRKKTTITIVNYRLYQDSENHKKTTERPLEDQSETNKEPQKDTNNNDNNANNVNNENKSNIMPGAENTAHEPEAPKPIDSVIDLLLNDKSQYSVIQDQLAEWSELFPGIDVMQQLRNMKAWLVSNPTKRKTRRGILKFITGWLAREQDKGGRGGSYHGSNKSKSGIEPISESRKQAYVDMTPEFAVDLWDELEVKE